MIQSKGSQGVGHDSASEQQQKKVEASHVVIGG